MEVVDDQRILITIAVPHGGLDKATHNQLRDMKYEFYDMEVEEGMNILEYMSTFSVLDQSGVDHYTKLIKKAALPNLVKAEVVKTKGEAYVPSNN